MLKTIRGADPPDDLVAVAPAMMRAMEELRAGMIAEQPLLIGGESGAGVGTLTRWAHDDAGRGAFSVIPPVAEADFPPLLDKAMRTGARTTLLIRAFDELSPQLQRDCLSLPGSTPDPRARTHHRSCFWSPRSTRTVAQEVVPAEPRRNTSARSSRSRRSATVAKTSAY